MKLMRTLALALLPLAFCAQAAPEAAGGYPSHPIRLVVGFSAGGATDVSARLFAKYMGDVLGQPVVVENRAGAAGTLSADVVAHSPADGYTLLYTTSSIHGISPNIYSRLGWDPLRDFAPIALVAKYPQTLLVNNDVPAGTLAELVALVERSPGKYSYASAGSGGTQHLAAALLASAAGMDMVHVPYKGMSAAYPDLMAGRVQLMFENAPSALPFVQRGAVRALAVSSAGRLPALPDVPTVAESGYPGFEVVAWSGFVAPAGTPRPVIDTLNAAILKASQAPELKAWLVESGSPTDLVGPPAKFGEFLKHELAFWKKAVEISGAKVE